MTSVKLNRIRILSMEGNEFSKVSTRPRMPSKELSVRKGRKILITLTADTLADSAARENQPRITTKKSI